MTTIFHFLLDHRLGGPHVYVLGIAQGLGSSVTSVVATTGQGDVTDWALTNLRHQFRLFYPLEIAVNVVRICWRFRRQDSRRSLIFDVHGSVNLAPIIAARFLGVPLVWHFHETLADFSSLVRVGRRAVSGLAHKYVVVAARAKTVFSLPDAIHIPGSVDVDFWRIEDAQRPAFRPISLLTVGNLNPLKGLDILLRALENVNFPFRLVVVGAPLRTHADYASKLREQAARISGPERSIEFAGWGSPPEIRSLMAKTDIFVLPSRSEACPIALLEAMAAGRACVATNVGDVADIVAASAGGSAGGIVVESEDPDALSTALANAEALGYEGRRDMGRRARARILANHSMEQLASRHLEIYRQLVEKD